MSPIEIDQHLFRVINQDMGHSFLDHLMPYLTDFHKTPIGIFSILALTAWFFYKHRQKSFKVVLMLGLALALSDLITYRVFKAYYQRPRPEFVLQDVTLRTHQHRGTSFPSNHASNNFAAATVLSLYFPPWAPLFVGVATLVAFSRIYVGVHFPADVVAGSMLGAFIGFLLYILVENLILPKWRSRKAKHHLKPSDKNLHR